MSTVQDVMSGHAERGLPRGWRWAQLGEVCVAKTGARDPRYEPDRLFQYVDISGVDNTSKTIVAAKTLLGRDAPSRARKIIRTGDVLVSTTRPNLNAVAMVPEELNEEICSTGFCILRAGRDVEPLYLFAFVRSKEFIDSLAHLVRGALYPAVTDSHIYRQWLPLPPIGDQMRIAAILTKQMAAVVRAREAVEAQLGAAEALPAAYLREVFEGGEAAGWPARRLGDVLQLRKEVVHPHDNSHGAARFVGLEHIEPGTGKRIGTLDLQMEKLTGRKPRFRTGDIVYGYLRPYLNKVWVAEFDGLCSVDQYVYRVDARLAIPEFIAWFMRSPTYLARAPIDLTPGQLPRIRTNEVASVKFGLPDIARQRTTVDRMDVYMATAHRARTALASQTSALDGFQAALLRRAMSGDP